MDDWLAELDAQAARSPTFLESKPVVLDLGGVTPADGDLPGLVRSLQSRGLRILSIEGGDPSWAGSEAWKPTISGGRLAGPVQPEVVGAPDVGAPAVVGAPAADAGARRMTASRPRPPAS